ncbi:MAG: transposase [Pseudomonadota bacterium]
MARKPRLHAPGALYHVMLRGNGGQAIFHDDADRIKLQELVGDGVRRFGHRIHAYCWMGNHIHLAVQVDVIPLSKIMHNLSFRYTSYFNWRHEHIGHLFQGRFKAILVDADSYLLQLVRYIHLNPVRAGMLKVAEQFAWSGHRAYLGLTRQPWLCTEWVLSQFGGDLRAARQRYRHFVGTHPDAKQEPDFKCGGRSGGLIGDEQVAHHMIGMAVSHQAFPAHGWQAICAAVCIAAGISEQALRSPSRKRALARARAAAAFLIMQYKAGTLAEFGRHIGRDPSSLSRFTEIVRSAPDDDATKRLVVRAGQILNNATSHA